MAKPAKTGGTTGLVPRLRFPEFRGKAPWAPVPIGNACVVTQGGTPSTTLPEYWNGSVQWLTPAEMGGDDHKYIERTERTITEDGLRNCSSELLPPNSVVISTRAPIGHLAINIPPMAINQGCHGLIPNAGSDARFIYFSLTTARRRLNDLGSGNTFKELAGRVLASTEIPIPGNDEQQEIADCLSSLDDIITAHADKLATLKQHKQGLLEQLFPREGETVPRLRFPEFQTTGSWTTSALGDICTIHKGKAILRDDVVVGGRRQCIRYGELYTMYGEIIHGTVSATNLPDDQLFLSESGDVIVPASGETKEDIATASCVTNGGVALGGDLNVIRSPLDGSFFAYYVRGILKTQIARVAQGDSVVHLYPSQLSKTTISYPSKPEQQRIAACLSTLDDVIAAESDRLAALKQHKQGLLQQLFPVMDAAAA